MSVPKATKLRWFDRGAAAFERTFPGRLAAQFGEGCGPHYVCPLCDCAFERSAIQSGDLTAEHVPPACFGGRELLLTCRRCNSEAGSLLDSQARHKEDVLAVASRRATRKPLKVRIRRGPHTLNARLTIDGAGNHQLKVVGKANSPSIVEAFREAGPILTGETLTVEFFGNRWAELGAKMSWFRSGFLALFAGPGGYAFSFDPAVQIVKRQLASPTEALIPCFTTERQDDPGRSWSQWRVLAIGDPACTAVMFGRYVLFYPNRGDLTLYQRIADEIRRTGTRGMLTGRAYDLISWEPAFGYEIGSEPATLPHGG